MVIRPTNLSPSRVDDRVGRRRDLVGRHTGPFAREIDLDQGVDGPPGRRGSAGQPFRRMTTGERLDHVGHGGDMVRGVGLERADEVPSRIGDRGVLVPQLLHVVLPEVGHARVEAPIGSPPEVRSCSRPRAGPRRRRAPPARRRARCHGAPRRRWPSRLRASPSSDQNRRNAPGHGTGGGGLLSAKRRGKGASSLGTSPPPTARGRAGTDVVSVSSSGSPGCPGPPRHRTTPSPAPGRSRS